MRDAFAVVYRFRVKPGSEATFEQAWEEVTKMIYQYEGSLGSRLHLSFNEERTYIAYAMWPSRQRWKDAGSRMPSTAKPWSQAMKDSCESIETLHELSPCHDLIKQNTHDSI
jgi:heme-degrading monooxygenase HmoA